MSGDALNQSLPFDPADARAALVQLPRTPAVFALYGASPAPYGFFADFGAVCVCAASPELALEVRGTRIRTAPIKGTRPRGRDARADRELALELDRDAKEHVAHFGANPKPWTQWRLRLWYCHPHIMSLLDWARASGYKLPPLPWSFEKRNRLPAYALALAGEAKAKLRSTAGKILRTIKK